MVDEMTEEVVEQITEAAPEFIEAVDGIRTSFVILGVVLAAASGAAAGYFIADRRAKLKYQQIADEEIAEMREHYYEKGLALEAEKGKGDLAQIVKDKGYVSTDDSRPPMAVQPPKSVVESEDDRAGEAPDDSAMSEDDVEGPNGVKVRHHNVFNDREVVVPYEWDLNTELKRRTPDTPYVIHYDERDDMDGYSQVSYTYYAADDVLCNENDEVVDPNYERDNLVGEANLERFGHGSNSPEIVFIRNDNLEMVMEIVKSPNSFATEVHGFSHEGWERGNLERMRRQERNEEY